MRQYVTEALADENVTVEQAQLRDTGDGAATLEVTLRYDGEILTATVPVTL